MQEHSRLTTGAVHRLSVKLQPMRGQITLGVGVMEWISLKLNISTSTLFLSFEINLALF